MPRPKIYMDTEIKKEVIKNYNKLYKDGKKDNVCIKRTAIENIPRTEKKLLSYYNKIIEWNKTHEDYIKPNRLYTEEFIKMNEELEKSYIRTENPISEKSITEKQTTEKQTTEKPITENQEEDKMIIVKE
jgi:hypothetical protein